MMNPWVAAQVQASNAASKEAVRDSVFTAARAVLESRGERTYCWEPQPGPQTEALATEAYEILYGGQAGGGKTDLALGAFTRGHRLGVLFRRTYPMLDRGIIPRSREVFTPVASFNSQRHCWEFANGALLFFSHLQHAADVLAHLGPQYDYVAFDELTQFTRYQYVYLFSRLRTAKPGVRVRMLATTNPGGEGNDFVMERWGAWLDPHHPNPAKPGEIRWYAFMHKSAGASERTDCAVDGPGMLIDPVTGEKVLPASRTFIAASLDDNLRLERREQYRASLQLLPEPYRSQLLYGDWTVGLVDDARQVIPSFWVSAAVERGLLALPAGRAPEALQRLRLLALGVDCARGGGDAMVIVPKYEQEDGRLRIGAAVEIPGVEVPDGPAALARIATILSTEGPDRFDKLTGAKRAWAPALVNVDAIGIGASVYDMGTLQGLDVEPVIASAASTRRDRSGQLGFANMRAELWWTAREALDPNGPNPLAIPNDPKLIADLKSARWEFSGRGIQIDKKDDQREILGRSPNHGDAMCLALYEPERAISSRAVALASAGTIAPAEAEKLRIVSASLSLAEGSRGVIVSVYQGRAVIAGEFHAIGTLAEQAARIKEALKPSGVKTPAPSLLIVSQTGEGDLAEYAYELRRLRVASSSGWAASLGQSAFEELAAGGRLTLAAMAVLTRRALTTLRRAAPTASEGREGGGGEYVFLGDHGYARAALDASYKVREVLKVQKPPEPDRGRLGERERLEQERMKGDAVDADLETAKGRIA